MYKNIILLGFLLFLSNCNQHSNVNQHNLNNSFVLIKIKTFEDDTALGTFDCRV